MAIEQKINKLCSMLSKKQFGILPVPSVATGLPMLLWRTNSVLKDFNFIVHIAEKKDPRR